MSIARVKVGRTVGVAFVLAAMFLYWWVWMCPHSVELNGPKAAAALGQLTHMPASSFGEARYYRVSVAYRSGPPRCSFVATPEVIKNVIVALRMDQPEFSRVRESNEAPKWWNDAARESTNNFVYYTGTSIEMWVSPKDGRCFLLNHRGT